MFTNNYYQTSTDYKRLFELLKKGYHIACLLFDYECGIKQDYKCLCEAKSFGEFDILFSTAGVIYMEIRPSHNDGIESELKIFIKKCREHGVEWIVSNSHKA